MDEIINKVGQSGLIQLDLEELRPSGERIFFDLAPCLFMGLALKEKDFRAFVQEHDWTQYQSKHVAVGCSVDAIIPTWAYMLISIHLASYAQTTVFGTLADLEKTLYSAVLNELDLSPYRDGRIVIKGCSKESVPTDVYVQISTLFQPIVKSLFFGEPCSTVPLYKQKKTV
jgi:hypothetical protein